MRNILRNFHYYQFDIDKSEPSSTDTTTKPSLWSGVHRTHHILAINHQSLSSSQSFYPLPSFYPPSITAHCTLHHHPHLHHRHLGPRPVVAGCRRQQQQQPIFTPASDRPGRRCINLPPAVRRHQSGHWHQLPPIAHPAPSSHQAFIRVKFAPPTITHHSILPTAEHIAADHPPYCMPSSAPVQP